MCRDNSLYLYHIDAPVRQGKAPSCAPVPDPLTPPRTRVPRTLGPQALPPQGCPAMTFPKKRIFPMWHP